MRRISVADAMTQVDCLLDDVERGETILITREGRVIARMTPIPPDEIKPDIQADSSAAAS